MKRILRSVRAVDLRLALAVAVCVVLFVAQSTTPTGSEKCGFESDYGSTWFINQIQWSVDVKMSGASPYGPHYITISAMGTGGINRIRTGVYVWSAIELGNPNRTLFTAGTVIVKKDETVSVVLN